MSLRTKGHRGVQFTSIAVLLISSSAWAGGQRPAMQRMLMPGSESTLNVTTGGGVAQTGVPAAIYRSTQCGFVSWIGGVPAWLDEAILFNDGGDGAPLRTISTRACFDVCTLGGLCGSCQCMTATDLPFDLTVQMYDGNPCESGLPVAGASGTQTFDQSILGTSFGGTFQCFRLNFAIDPKVQIPHDGWIEQIMGVDDAWVFTGRPNSIESQGESNLSGLDDGVTCSTFCDIGGASCSNDPDRCDWMVFNLDSNAEILFSLRPVPVPAGSKHAAGSTYTVVDDEAILRKGGEPVFLDVSVSEWEPGVRVDAWASGVDSSGYTSGLRGTLTPIVVPCDSNADCLANLGIGAHCGRALGNCQAAMIDTVRSDYIFHGLVELLACDVGSLDYRCASTLLFGESVESQGRDSYLWTLVLQVPDAAKGTFTIDLKPPPNSALLDVNDGFLAMVGVVPGKITVETAACCDLSGGPGNEICLEEDATANECAAAGGAWSPGVTCENCDLLCLTDEACDDADACTVDQCVDNLCAHSPAPLGPEDCCDPAAGIAGRDDGDPCTVDSCSGGGQDGVPEHTPAASGTPCDDGDDCTLSDTCNALGICTGEPDPTCTAVPTISAWGGVIMTGLLLVGARVFYRRREGPAKI